MGNKKNIKCFLLILFLLIGCASTRETTSWKKGQLPQVAQEITNRLNNNEKIKVVIMGNAETSFPVSKYGSQADLDNWKKLIVNQTRSETESSWINYFGGYENFEVVDRSLLDTILKEQYLGATGALSQRDAVEVGKLSGANYLMYFEFIRSPRGSYGMVDTTYLKLISIETSKILATQWGKAIK